MKMEGCTAAILLMLSLEALVAGLLSAAVADDGVDTIIRLPIHGNNSRLAKSVLYKLGMHLLWSDVVDRAGVRGDLSGLQAGRSPPRLQRSTRRRRNGCC
jgi:hypothetical protein